MSAARSRSKPTSPSRSSRFLELGWWGPPLAGSGSLFLKGVSTGLIELGSNSFRVLVTSDAGDEILRRSEHLHLAAKVAVHGFLERDDIVRASRTAVEFVRLANDYGCIDIDIVASEVFRLAGNGRPALEHIAKQAGHSIHLLSGDEEALLAWRGATAALPVSSTCTVADLGGGSLNLASGPTFDLTPEIMSTHRVGVSLLASLAQEGDLFSSAARVRLEHHVNQQLRADAANHAGRPVVLVGGWARTLAQLVHTARRGQVPDSVHGLSLDTADLGHIIARVSGLSSAARLAMPGMKHRRAKYLPVAATVLRQVMRSLDASSAQVSVAGLRDGATRSRPTTHRRESHGTVAGTAA
jgi:exopolyphosphatase / guanosine-5'-triphosphate,3'-diphosphate pyrophosphatase